MPPPAQGRRPLFLPAAIVAIVHLQARPHFCANFDKYGRPIRGRGARRVVSHHMMAASDLAVGDEAVVEIDGVSRD